MTRSHGTTALGDGEPMGRVGALSEYVASGRFPSDTFTILRGCYAQKRVESICREQFGKHVPPSAGSSFATTPRTAVFHPSEELTSLGSFHYREVHRDR